MLGRGMNTHLLSHLHAETGLLGALLVLALRVSRVDHAGQPVTKTKRAQVCVCVGQIL